MTLRFSRKLSVSLFRAYVNNSPLRCITTPETNTRVCTGRCASICRCEVEVRDVCTSICGSSNGTVDRQTDKQSDGWMMDGAVLKSFPSLIVDRHSGTGRVESMMFDRPRAGLVSHL